MDNISETVALLRRQAELERQLMNGDDVGVMTERELEMTRLRLAAHPQAVNAVLQTARALRRTPDSITRRDVTDWAG